MAELYHVIPGRITEDSYCYWGPEHGRFLTDPDSVPSYNQQVDILWREGNFYYIKYLDSATNAYKRMCYPCDCIEVIGVITPTLHTPPVVPGCFRSITENTKVYNILEYDNPGIYTTQNEIPHIGSVNYKETVRYLGLTIDGYALVEYDIKVYYADGTSDDKRKRGWVDASKLGTMPNPTGTVYASTRGGIPASQQDANARFIYDYLRAYGFNHNSACGVLGNIFQECSMNPAKWQIIDNNTDVPDITYGYGLFQWDPATNYLRRAVTLRMIDFRTAAAIDNFVNVSDANKKALMLSQLEFMLAGCFAQFQWYKPADAYDNKMTIQEFMVSNKTPEELAEIFHDHFERSSRPEMDNRKAWAREYSDRFQ